MEQKRTVRPLAGAGIEITPARLGAIFSMFAPSRGRELKSGVYGDIERQQSVRPLAGAGIEIARGITCILKSPFAPSRGRELKYRGTCAAHIVSEGSPPCGG